MLNVVVVAVVVVVCFNDCNKTNQNKTKLQ